MSSNSFQKLKETYSKQRRKEEVQKKIAEKRKQLNIQVIQQERQTFLELLPKVSLENYEENRLALFSFARSLDYSYQMLPVAFISFEYLLANPFDLPSWQILANLSYYEDFQIPQTERFAKIFTQFFNTQISVASQFLLNLSSLPKCSLLCCRLVDEGIVQIIGQNMQQNGEIYWKSSLQNANFTGKEDVQILIYNLLTALSNIFTLKPLLEMEQMVKICELINYQARSNKFLKQVHDETIFKLLQNVISQFPQQRNVLQMLVFQFSETLNDSFFTYEEESLLFMNLCVKNKVKLNEKLFENLFVSIKSKNNKNKISALKLLQKILKRSDEKERMQIQNFKQNNFQKPIFSSTLPSFQEFNSMFSTHKEVKQPKEYENQEQINTIIAYSLLFNEDYEKTLHLFLEMCENSGQKVQQQIIELVKVIVKCIIRQVTSFQAKKILTFYDQHYVVPEMEDILSITVEAEQMYIFLNECLKSSNKQIILCALQILKDLIIFFKQEQQTHLEQEMNVQNMFEFLLNSLHKFNIYSSINSLMDHSNAEITQLSQVILDLIDEST